MDIKNLAEVISVNSNFKTSINLYLSLNKKDKILNYIPTQSSVEILDDYLRAVIEDKQHATLLVGPYGKGKSHLLLVLMAILSLKRNEENAKIISTLKNKVKSVENIGNKTATNISKVWKNKAFLPVIINTSGGDLNQAFLSALDEALKREGLEELSPDTFYSEAIKRIEDWKNNFKDTYNQFLDILRNYSIGIDEFITNLKMFSLDALNIFKDIYPLVTAGSTFNPLAVSEVLPLYKATSDKLVEDYGYEGIYIIFDEFSKFIEGLDNEGAGNKMKMLQDICELAADSSSSKLYITFVAHKSIKEYGKYLSPEIINLFTGIEGRVVEKFFITYHKNNYELIKNAIIKDEHKIKKSDLFGHLLNKDVLEEYYNTPTFKADFTENDFERTVFKGCFPLNPIASYLLVNTSEKVGQNERTLFTFISNDEPNSLVRKISNNDKDDRWFVGADAIYDYFKNLFKKDVLNELVHNIWLSAEYALSKCKTEEQKIIIKALAIILIVNKSEELPANEKYLYLATQLENVNDVISTLEEEKLIYKKKSTGYFVFKTRAGIELKSEVKKQRGIKGSNINYANTLKNITNKYYVIPRRYNTENMMTRYFNHEFMDVDAFLSINDANVLFDEHDYSDGKVLVLFSFDDTKQEEICMHFKELNTNKLVIVSPFKLLSNEKDITDFEILQEIRNNQVFINNNEILKKELPLLEEDISEVVNGMLRDVYCEESCRVIYYSGDLVLEEKYKNIEKVINACCEEVYYKTPVINNELINRTFINTSQTKKSRLNIINAILNHEDDEAFYVGTNQEATIYRALFCGTKIKEGNPDKNIKEIIEIINNFINECSDNKNKFSSLINTLTSAPYGMRRGVIPLYLAYVLSKRKEDLIVYFANMEVQLSPEIIVNICSSPEEYELYVSKEDYTKELYLKNINELFDITDKRINTGNRIKDTVVCMQRWFRALPQVTRNMISVDRYIDDKNHKASMKALKKILLRVEFNPYEILFIEIPKRLKVDSLDKAFEIIKICKELFESYLEWVISEIIKNTYDVFAEYKNMDLFHIFKEWYDSQSELSKQGLHNGGITSFMSCVKELNVYNDSEVIQKISKVVTNTYVENWIGDAIDDYYNKISELKIDIENIVEEKEEGKLLLSFTGQNGEKIEKYYDKASESTGTILRNILEDTLEEYDDLSVNDRVAILLEMIEKVIR